MFLEQDNWFPWWERQHSRSVFLQSLFPNHLPTVDGVSFGFGAFIEQKNQATNKKCIYRLQRREITWKWNESGWWFFVCVCVWNSVQFSFGFNIHYYRKNTTQNNSEWINALLLGNKSQSSGENPTKVKFAVFCHWSITHFAVSVNKNRSWSCKRPQLYRTGFLFKIDLDTYERSLSMNVSVRLALNWIWTKAICGCVRRVYVRTKAHHTYIR